MVDDYLIKKALKRTPQMIMDTAVDEAQERIKLKDQIAELKYDKTMLEYKVSVLNTIIDKLRMEK